MTDELILNRILETVNPRKQDQFFEIGCGRGALTKRLIPKIKSIDGVEIDKDLISSLRKLESSSTDLTIHQDLSLIHI